LRARSIALVVGYHAQPWLAAGGFIGVDIFFVISGFRITGIILTELDAGTFSPLKFYARRVRRIFPALMVVLFATYLIGWFVLLPDGFSLLGENIAAGVAFVSNLFQLRHAGYFAPAASENPLLHLWSLGIEEQLYFLAAGAAADGRLRPAAPLDGGPRTAIVQRQSVDFPRLQGVVVLLAAAKSIGVACRRQPCRSASGPTRKA
jgi:peptidoglycan/LPS O-acetylase OafA/YrhL